jgi:HYDIN/CFA65/VesB-like, Ig-like domain/Cep192 domain 4
MSTSTATATETPTATPTPNGARIAIVPRVVIFPVTGIGLNPASKSLTIRNVGNGTLLGEVEESSLTSPFKVTPSAGSSFAFSLDRGEKASFTIQFAPTQIGRVSQRLEILSNDRRRPIERIRVSGVGAGGSLAVARTFTLPSTRRNTTVTRTLTLRNRGRGVLSGTIDALQPPFEVTSSTVFDLQPGEPFPITIAFTPTAKGLSRQSLVITTDPPTQVIRSVTVRGRGK